MPSPRKPKGKAGKNPLSASALAAEQRQVEDQQRKVQDQIAALQRIIDDPATPQYKHRATATAGDHRAAQQRPPAGKRYPETKRPRGPVRLRKEKEEGRLQTFAMLALLVIIVIWALSRYI